MKKTNWANVLTWTRLILLAPITIAAFMHERIIVAVLFAIAELTDALDGIVARKTGMASEKGAQFDSQVDNIMLPFVILWFVLLYPNLIKETYVWLIVVMSLVALQLIMARIKLGVWTGLHLWSDKFAAIFAAFSIFILLLFGDVGWTRTIYYVMIIIGSLSMIEGIIYLLKGGKNIDARSLFFE